MLRHGHSKNAKKAADAAVLEAKANLHSAQLDLEFTQMRAPLDGYVTKPIHVPDFLDEIEKFLNFAPFRLTDSLMTGHPEVDSEHEQLVVLLNEVVEFLKVGDDKGCTAKINELTKALKSHFENEREMIDTLKPYGFRGQVYKEAKKLANDRMRALSIGRHAPLKGTSVQSIDTKWLLSDPTGRKAFETGEKACRNIIDSYLQFRTAGNS